MCVVHELPCNPMHYIVKNLNVIVVMLYRMFDYRVANSVWCEKYSSASHIIDVEVEVWT